MTRAASNVSVKFTLKGEDKASAAINSAAQSTDRLRQSMGKAAETSSSLADSLRAAFSGDIRGSISGITSALGGAGGGGGFAAAAGMATVSTAAFAAAATGAAIKTLEWATEVERVNTQLRRAFGSAEDAIAFANAVGGVSAENVAKLRNAFEAANVKGEITVELLQKMTARASRFGRTGDEAVQAFTAALTSGETGQLRSIGLLVDGEQAVRQYAKAVGVGSDALDLNAKIQAIASETIDKANQVTDENSGALSRNEAALQRLNNTVLRAKLLLADLAGGPASDFLTKVLDLVDATIRWGKVIAALMKLVLSPFLKIIQAQVVALAGLKKVFDAFRESPAAAGKALREVGAELADVFNLVKDFQDIGAEFRKAMDPAADATSKAADSMVNALGRVNETAGKVSAGLRQMSATAKKTVKPRARKRRRGPSEEQQIQAAVGDLGELFAEEAAPIKALQARAAAQRDLMQAQIETATNPARKAELELQAIEIANAEKLAALRQQFKGDDAALAAATQAQALRVEASRTKVLGQLQTQQEQMAQADAQHAAAAVDSAFAIGKATAQGVASMVESERKRAGIMAIVATADAALAAVRQDYAGAIAGAFAAASYARVALSGGGGASAGAGRFGAGGGTRAERETQQQGTQAAAGPRNVNITFGAGFVIGTAQQVGKSVGDAMKSLDGTGYEAAA